VIEQTFLMADQASASTIDVMHGKVLRGKQQQKHQQQPEQAIAVFFSCG
tara:strand:- start:22109 stop:22255 length:147 start_codon:yes stop_codon:yes gene_type:complete